MAKKPANLTLESSSDIHDPFPAEPIAPPADAEAPPPVPDLPSGAPSEPIPLAPAPDGEAGAPKRKHTRRTKAQMAAEAAAVQEGPPPVSAEDLARTEAAFAATFKALTMALAKRRGPHWALTDEETGTLGSVWAAAVAPYLHKVGPAVPWVSAAVVTWSIFQPRIATDQEKKALEAGPVPAA